MTPIDYTSVAKSRYTALFNSDPVYDAIVSTVTQLLELYQDQYISIFDSLLNIDKSSGVQLDLIGKLIGQDRVLANFVNTPYFGFEDAPLAQSFGTVSNPAVGGEWWSITNPPTGSNRALDDNEYRRILKARILKNNSNGTIDSLLSIINTIDGSVTSSVSVNSTCDVNIVVVNPTLILYYFLTRRTTSDSIIPIPVGVRTRIKVIT
jgi:hypothetical protein